MSTQVQVKTDTSPGSAEVRETETHGQRLERLFREHNDSLVRLLQVRLQSRDEAKEAAQEAYVQLLGLDQPDSVSFLKAYLFRTAVNIAKDRVKQKSRRRRIEEIHLFGPERVDSSSPEAEWGADRDLATMRQELDQLPALCREAFELVRLEGLSFDEAAIRLGMNSRRVRRYVHRVMQHFAAILELEDAGGGTP